MDYVLALIHHSCREVLSSLTVWLCLGRGGLAWAGHTELLWLVLAWWVVLSMSTIATLRFTRKE